MMAEIGDEQIDACYPFSDSDDEGQRFRHMSRDEWRTYIKQVNQSDGFEVDGIPDVHEFHQIQPIADHEIEESILYAKTAIDKFNNSVYKIEEGELEFDQLVRATAKLVYGLMFYLTFTAKKKNLAIGSVENCTYQAVVLWGRKPADGLAHHERVDVLSFRRKPSGPEKDWFWQEHECGC